MKCYISGKISGLLPEQVTAKFRQAEQQIRAFGHEPVNPLDNGVDKEASWNEHFVADVALLLECDAIYLLKDWAHRGDYCRRVRLGDYLPTAICYFLNCDEYGCQI